MRTRSDYGNGDYTVPTYDTLDRVTAMSYNGIENYNWVYGADGRIGLHNDIVNGVTWRYEYTKDGDLTAISGSNGERFTYTYDTATGKLLSVTDYDGNTSKVTTYNYNDHVNGDKKNLIDSVVLPTGTVSYDYDGFYRASYGTTVGSTEILSTDYTFLSGTAANSTSLVVASMTNAGNNWSNTLSYTYDDNGNIVTISEGNTLKATYTYDDLNQLVREDNVWLGKTIAYTYDKGGNIQLVEEYTLTSGALNGLTALDSYEYLYGDSNWRDKLTSYDGNSITYDAIGNPLSYYNGYTFDWQNGRQLASVTGTGLTASYKYNADGIRTQKTVNGVTTNYTLEGSSVVKETNGTDTLWYYYDATGSVTSFELNGIPYFYVKNTQGDVIAITDATGNKVVEYVYDSWGKLVSTTGSLASTVGEKNPYRYREYRYDTETGLYYLQSRYYDAETGRFINADSQLTTGKDLIGTNLFAYCGNNPTSRLDPSGHAWWHWAIAAAVVVVCAVAVVATAGGAAPAIMAVGAVASGFAAPIGGAAATVAAGAFIGSSMVLGGAALISASNSKKASDFNAQGNWGTVAATACGGAFGAASGYAMYSSQTSTNDHRAQETFLPDEYYTSNKAPANSTPYSSITNYMYNSYTGEYEKSSVYYDFAGRQALRIDWTNHGRADHGDPHVHVFFCDGQYRDGISKRWD